MATILPVTREATPVKMFENMILESKQDKRSIQNKKRIKDPFKTRTGSFIRSCFEWIFYTFLVLNGSFIRFLF
jgi:hypothetical protein